MCFCCGAPGMLLTHYTRLVLAAITDGDSGICSASAGRGKERRREGDQKHHLFFKAKLRSLGNLSGGYRCPCTATTPECHLEGDREAGGELSGWLHCKQE